jgi:NADH-quinone oxidoreductase subunit C
VSEFVETPRGVAEPQPEPLEPDHPIIRELAEQFEDVQWATSYGERVAFVPRERLREFATAARGAGFEMCVDVTAVDYLHRRPRFEVLVMLLSLHHQQRLRLRVALPGDDPTVPSLVPVYPGANYFEREAYDMFGIEFTEHPDLSRILMPDDWEGHPLRKDYPVGAVSVQFKDAPKVS